MQGARRKRRPSRLLHRTSRITAATPTVSSRQLPSTGNIIAFREVDGLHHTPRAPGHRSLQRTPACRGTADSSPLLCLDEPRIAQRGGLCRHGGGLSGCGAARRAISAQYVRVRVMGFTDFGECVVFLRSPIQHFSNRCRTPEWIVARKTLHAKDLSKLILPRSPAISFKTVPGTFK